MNCQDVLMSWRSLLVEEVTFKRNMLVVLLLLNFLIDRGLHEVKMSLHLCYVLLNMPIISLVSSSLFIGKSYPHFIHTFTCVCVSVAT